VGFNFEPEFTEVELEERDMAVDTSLANNSIIETREVEEWCECERCRPMNTALECVCCRSSDGGLFEGYGVHYG